MTEIAINLEEIVTDSAHPAERHYCFPKHRQKPDIESVAALEKAAYEFGNMRKKRFIELQN